MNSAQLSSSNIEDTFPLSPIQAGMLFHSLMDPDAGIYLEQTVLRIDGDLDLCAFEEAWQCVVDQNEVLRIAFRWEGLETPLQVVHQQVKLPFRLHDYQGLSDADQKSRLETLLADDRREGFDFSAPPLMRIHLIHLAEKAYQVIWSNHHTLLDGWSQSLVLKQVFNCYEALARGETPVLESSAAYRKYFDWLASQDFDEAEEYWRRTLKGFAAPTQIGCGEPHTKVVIHAEEELRLSETLSSELGSFAQKQRLTLFTLVQAAWALLLSRYSGADDVVFGATVSVRPPELPDLESVNGLFINTIPIRAFVSSQTDVLSWMKEIQMEGAEAREYQQASLVDIHGWSEVPRDQPLFESILVFENYLGESVEGLLSDAIKVERVRSILSRTNYPIALLVFPGVQLTFQLVCDSERFDKDEVQRMLGHLRAILEEFIAAATKELGAVRMLTPSEQHRLLVEWNQTSAPYESDRCVHQLFESQVERAPESIAVEFEDQRLTYAELNARANRLARYLRTMGVKPESLVGISIDRSLEMVIGLLGILKAGAAYVPLDPAFPKERLAFMIEDANLPLILTQEEQIGDLPPHQARTVCIDSDWQVIERESAENLESLSTTKNLAYVIYTSGSTGKPKGVEVGHRALTNLLCSVRREPGLTAADVLVSITTLSFDIAALELYSPLITGARLVIAGRDVAADGLQLQAKLTETKATVVQATPATWKMLIDAGWQGDEQLKILCGGEALSRELADQLLERSGSLWNMYGPTETTIWSTICKVESDGQSISIGRPLANTLTYLLDKDLNPVPIGVAGELHIGGDGLARGYLNRPELTSEKFIRSPFAGDPSVRLYKTGDLARYLPDGRIECLGRVDDQVKIRGFRIELGEIESVLRHHSTVRDCVVVAREDSAGDRRLVGYVVASDGAQVDHNELRELLRECLPDYMIPSAFVLMNQLPLTPNGKVNRRALPPPDYKPQSESYASPRTPIEEQLAEIWADVLKVSRVGVNDNFFELGGHSLLATLIISRVVRAFQTQLPLRVLFEAPTVARMAEHVEPSRQDSSALIAPPIMPLSRNGSAPLSFGQQSFWFLDSLTPNTSAYNLAFAVRLKGHLETAAFERALDRVMTRHESMRTTFSVVDGQPVQMVLEEQRFDLTQIDLGHLLPAQREAELKERLQSEAERPFDLAHGPLIRATLFRLAADEQALLFSMHHIVADDWSMGILCRELTELYNGFVNNEEPELAALPVQYADFAVWQQGWLQNGVLDKQLEYWKNQLAGAPALLELPTDRPRLSSRTFRGAHHTLVLPPELREKLAQLSRREGVSLFMAMLAAFQALLARHSGQDDIVVGSPIAGRNRMETEHLVGHFINTLVLRTSLDGDPTFSELLGRVRDVALGAYAHQEAPFEKLVEELQPERSLNHTPLFQALFVFQNAPTAELNFSGLSATIEEVHKRSSAWDLTLEARETSDGLRCVFEYKTDLFDANTIARLAERLRILLEMVVEDPQRKIYSVALLTEGEQQQLLLEWNRTERDFPNQICAPQLFEAQVERSPNATAVVFEDQRLTYKELNERANRLAHHLRGLGVGPETLVGISVERSLELAVGIIGILKAGAAYVPLDPMFPKDRLAFMIEDTNVPVLLTSEPLIETLPPHNAKIVCLDRDWPLIARESANNPVPTATSENIAYVIYTSGSTGRPKGVRTNHLGFTNLLFSLNNEFELTPDDVLLSVTTFSFDIFLQDLFLPLIVGAKIVIVSREVAANGVQLKASLAKNRATVMQATPTVWRMLIEAGWHGHDRMKSFTGAEPLSRELADQLLERSGSVWNLYGPTESSIWTTVWNVEAGEVQPSIGRPLANARVYLLDKNLNPTPIGVPGELHIGGIGLARGYLNRPELTAEKFILNPFSNWSEDRLYRTGDLARYLADGKIECLGRIDDQVKIRGFRIELGEIESILRQHRSVRQCVVIAREDIPGDRRLVAYVVPAPGARADLKQLRSFLKEQLPDYMLPSAIVELDELPLTPTSKVNRKALPPPSYDAQPQETYVAPRNPVEKRLADIWAEVLKVPRVGINDNFFELGGHSLLAVRLFARIESVFGKHLPLATLFQAPTVAQLEQVLGEEEWDAPWSSLVAIQPKGSRRPLFCVHAAGGNVVELHELAGHLDPDQPFYAFQSIGLDGHQNPLTNVEDMAAHYLKEMREVQPHGPYLLGGRSFGGTVAFEMACQLHEQGERVALLALLDTYPVGYFKLQSASDSLSLRTRRFARRMRRHLDNLSQLNVTEQWSYLIDKAQYAPPKIKHQVWRTVYRLFETLNRPLPKALRIIEQLNFLAARKYTPRVYDGRVSLFSAAGDLTSAYDLGEGWRVLAPLGVDVHEIPGNHINIIKEPHVRGLAEKLRACLYEAQDHGLVETRAA